VEEGFAVCYIISGDSAYLAATLCFGFALAGAALWMYHYLKRGLIEFYHLNRIKLAVLAERSVSQEFESTEPSTRPLPVAALVVREEKEPLVDIINGDGTVRVIAELPGVDRVDIRLRCSGRSLTIYVDTESRLYRKEIELPAVVDSEIGRARFMNGVLEVTLSKV
jgi:HSP20 family molecular chaperone IbpA